MRQQRRPIEIARGVDGPHITTHFSVSPAEEPDAISEKDRALDVQLTAGERVLAPKRVIQLRDVHQSDRGFSCLPPPNNRDLLAPPLRARAEGEQQCLTFHLHGYARLEIELVLLVAAHVVELTQAALAGGKRYRLGALARRRQDDDEVRVV